MYRQTNILQYIVICKLFMEAIFVPTTLRTGASQDNVFT